MRRAPFLALLLLKSVIYLAIIFFALSVGELRCRARPIAPRRSSAARPCSSASASIIILFVFDIARLLGPNVLVNFILGRYYRPRSDQRVFLFADMEGSTPFAERLGPLDFHACSTALSAI